MTADAHGAYKQARVNTASQSELLLMLYDGAIKHGTKAVEALHRKNTECANTHLLKAQEIVAELMASLNYEVDFARNLFQLYEYCHHRLLEANVSKNAPSAEEALKLLTELRSTWYQALKGDKSQESGTVDVGAPNGRPTLMRGGGGIEFAR